MMLNGLADIETPRFAADRLDPSGVTQPLFRWVAGRMRWILYQWTKQVASHWGWHA